MAVRRARILRPAYAASSGAELADPLVSAPAESLGHVRARASRIGCLRKAGTATAPDSRSDSEKLAAASAELNDWERYVRGCDPDCVEGITYHDLWMITKPLISRSQMETRTTRITMHRAQYIH